MRCCEKQTAALSTTLAVLLLLLFLAFDHRVSGYDSMWAVNMQVHLIKSSSESSSLISPEERTSWGKCQCDVALGCIFITRGCATRVIEGTIVIAPVDPRANTKIGNALFQCQTTMTKKTRMATKNESVSMLQECPAENMEDALTMLNFRRFGFHPYHSVMNPTGALQHFSALNATQYLLGQYNLRLPPRIMAIPTSERNRGPYATPLPVTRLFEYALSHRYGEDTAAGIKPEEVNVTIAIEPSPLVSCSKYHTIGLLLIYGLFKHPNNGMTTPIPRQWAHEFQAFRHVVRSRSLSDYGTPPIDDVKPVLYAPRSIVCEGDRIRFIPTVHKMAMEEVFLEITNSSELEEDKFNVATIAKYPFYFRSVHSRRIIFASEGAFFTLMLVGRPETVWVLYYRAPPKNYRSHGFFTAMVRALPDLKLVVYVVTNGVSRPMSELHRAVTEPFIPGVPKFVGADAVGNPPKPGGKDPLFGDCKDILK